MRSVAEPATTELPARTVPGPRGPAPGAFAARRPSSRVVLGTASAVLLLVFWALGRRLGYGLSEYLQLLVDGTVTGSVYALVAVGFVVVYRVTGVINFAQGAFVMLGPMLAITFFRALGGSGGLALAAAAAAAVLATALVATAVHRLTLHPARAASALTRIIITVGVYIALQGLALRVWGPRPYVMPAFSTLHMADRFLEVGGVTLQAQSLWVWGVGLLTVVGLVAFFEHTLVGKAMRACAVNRTAARLMGIRVDRMATLAFALAGVLGAVGGIVLAPSTRPTYDMGLDLGLKGFVAAIAGGLVSLPGAVAGGLVLGVLESLWAGVTVAGFKDLFAFVMLILLLLARPQGWLEGGHE
ncbi:MAG: branched-chain amino acid ABC transporter permease [Armatimonadota bacterium]|nr:branched-chain amino acid ABC transporter permease [Armatimonadota bacterium]MDR7431342.1 branched-chain amino acid ABC transporter permease [Armatimonadota bacterium]MDR7477720.1 branched-chain amino acid ABC transporter permease [Armatimonadota bacterium]MDR7564088.1 branched-chain amino acid ABC transporter permease [Armatimonadota bacterium]MDR7579363.1 branched-chain amino acid ABC transporter permease [Armatimonadota bacterium]